MKGEASKDKPVGAWASPAAVDASERRVKLVLYVTAVFFFWFAQYFFVPILPIYVQTKTPDLATVGLVLSMYGLWQFLIRVPLGLAADWLGAHKPFILAGLALSGVGAWIMGASGGVEGIAVGRAITGIAAGAWVPLVVAFSALFPPGQVVRASAILTLFNSLGRILATALAGPLNEWGGTPIVFLVSTAVSLLSVLTILPLREERRPARPPSLGSMRQLLGRRDVMLPSILSGVGQWVNWAISFGFLIVLVKQLGGNSIAQGAAVTLHITLHATGSLLTSTLGHRFGNKRLLYASFAFFAIGILWAAFSNSLALIFVAPVFLGLGMGISYPVLMGSSIQKVGESERMTAMGLHQTIYAIGMFVGPAVSGGLADRIGLEPMFVLTAVGCLLAGFSMIKFMKDK